MILFETVGQSLHTNLCDKVWRVDYLTNGYSKKTPPINGNGDFITLDEMWSKLKNWKTQRADLLHQ